MRTSYIKKRIYKEFKQLHTDDLKDNILKNIELIEQDVPVIIKKKSYKLQLITLGFVVCALFISFILTKRFQNQYIVSLDVNPSIQLHVNNEERIEDVYYLKEEAIKVMDGINLKGTDINVAINAIIGRMFQHGYMDEIKNSVLVSVEGENKKERQQIKERLVDDIQNIFNRYDFQASVISQDFARENDINKLAKKYNVSIGKVKLIQEMINENLTYDFNDLTELPINDLNTLVHFNNIHFQSIHIDGKESHEGYLTEKDIKERVLQHSQIIETEIKDYSFRLDCIENRLIYDVNFKDSYGSYHYQINAISGEIINFKVNINTI